jgi:hypothetical protein
MDSKKQLDRYVRRKKLKNRLGFVGGLLLILSFMSIPLVGGNPKISTSFFEVIKATGLFNSFILPTGIAGLILLGLAFAINIDD